VFIREVKNRSGSISIQIISKVSGRYKVVKTIGSGFTHEEILLLKQKAKHELAILENQYTLFISHEDSLIESYISTLSNSQVRVVGPELIFGKIYDSIGFGSLKEKLFRHLVICRLVHPGSKLKTIDYLLHYQGVSLSVDSIYRFLDKLQGSLKHQVEQIAFEHTFKILKRKLSIIFYDLTTIYFEASNEDDLRKTGFSKEGKHSHPQIYLGLLVGMDGYPIGYDIFEGNIHEGKTLIPTLQKFEQKFKLSKPIVVADSGLLSSKNIEQLETHEYKYILGARIKNESDSIKQQILNLNLNNRQNATIKKKDNIRLIISYSDKRARKDENNRQRGLNRLEKNLNKGRLTKKHINNKGYNKYLKLTGDVKIEIDYEKFRQDRNWDGLKGYMTNSKLTSQKIIDNYNNLWQIEKAFRISKTDLRIRPIYHRLRNRIEAHICIAFTAYSIYKELERLLYKAKAPFSVKKAVELTHNIYELNITLPQSKAEKKILLKLNDEQKILISIIEKIS